MELNKESKVIRRKILEEAYKHKHGHIASCFSCVEILLAIKEVMKEDDSFILSKGHAILAEKAVFGKEISVLKTGSLGHGLSVACGIALGDREHNVYVVVGDGELQEGSCWEAYLFAHNKELRNLFVVIDFNKFQASHKIPYFLSEGILRGDYFLECDGHSVEEIKMRLSGPITGPNVINASTIKGKGSETISSSPIEWHTRIPVNDQEYNIILKEINRG